MSQNLTPIADALSALSELRLVPFDVPGHKRGKGNPELVRLFGAKAIGMDVNSSIHVDNLCHPISVIAEAEQLAANAFKAANAFFMVNGTTAAVQAMILAALINTNSPNKNNLSNKIILPRNVHISAINALILGGGVPVYVNPDMNKELGIPLGMRVDYLRKAMDENPDARAVLINNPTYYGVCSDLKEIIKLADSRGILVLADEAHGTHLYFSDENSPSPAIPCGADLSAVSMHKSGGSLTQSSMLLSSGKIHEHTLRQVINLTQTTSANYLLLASLDVSRRNLALRGLETFAQVKALADYARNEINGIGGYFAYGKEQINRSSFFAFDETKLVVNVSQTGLTGMEVYAILRDEFNIQAEFGDMHNTLFYLSIGDRERDIDRLISALAEIKRLYQTKKNALVPSFDYIPPNVVCSPKKAFYSSKKSTPLKNSKGLVSGEFVNVYPPGIPCLAPGELITDEIINYIEFAKLNNALLTGMADKNAENITVLV